MKLSMMTAVLMAFQLTAFAQSNSKCPDMAKFRSPGVTLEITRAEIVPAGRAPGARGGAPGPALPAHCRIDGMMDRRTGTDGKTYGTRFAIALPDNWTGQYLQQGGGGLNGTVGQPTGAQAAGDQPALARGFAVATTDTGHQSSGGAFDGSFMQDQQAALDFEFVAIGRVAVLARQIIESYYGRPPSHSYYVGCSTGGREAMLMAERYPLYFDGIVAGSPAMRTGHSNLATRSVTVALNRIAPKASDGRPVPGGALSDSDRKAIIAKILDVCDARDGLKDGMIFDVMGCDFKPADLQCPAAKADGCLSREQVDALTKAFAGPKDSRGNPVYPGFFFDTGHHRVGRRHSRPARFRNQPPRTADNSRTAGHRCRRRKGEFQSDGDHRRFLDVDQPELVFIARREADFLPRRQRPVVLGKRYHRLLQADEHGQWRRCESEGLEPPLSFSRHGTLQRWQRGSRQLRLSHAAVNWVEKNSPPESVTATGRAFPGRSRPLCAYPEHAQYTGKGNPEDAANFTCRP